MLKTVPLEDVLVVYRTGLLDHQPEALLEVYWNIRRI
jgi:hypothetical protein